MRIAPTNPGLSAGPTQCYPQGAHPFRLTWLALGLGAAVAGLCACRQEQPKSAALAAVSGDRPQAAPGSKTTAPTRDAPPEGTLEHIVRALGERFAAGWEASESRFAGTLEARGKQSFMAVLRYGRCYRFVAAGDDGIGDLDLILYDPASQPVQRDLSQDNVPVLGQQAHICPETTGAYRLDVSAYAGSGDFLVQPFESPH